MATTSFSTLNTEGVDLNTTYSVYDQTAAQSSTNSPDYPGLPAQLGTVVYATNDTAFVFVKASSAIAYGDVCQITTANLASPVATSTATFGSLVGVAQVAISSGYYGWIQRLGPCQGINTAAAAAVNVQLATTTTPGSIDDVTTTGLKNIDGLILTTTAGSATRVAGVLNWPKVGITN